MKTIKLFVLLFAIVVIAQSCRKESDDIITTPPIIEPQISVVGSVLGIITDENGIAVQDALVNFEDQSVLTDEYGVFQFENETLYSSGTYIKVSKDGYFHGSRRFYPSQGNTSIVNIELMPLEKVADFSSSNGNNVSFENVELDFKANSIMTEDGAPYNGNVNIAAKYLDPTLLSTIAQMPGDLTGVTTDQNRVALKSMAMIAVELYDDSGNELQVKEGQTVDVKIPVPQDLLGSAPSSIPMWHFDEEIGTWVEEGSATLVNGMYETSLAHFSFWNCDAPYDLVSLKGSVINRAIPVQGVTIVITDTGGGTSGSGITDANGFFCGLVPSGVDLTLTVYDQCGNEIYTMNIPASTVDILLDPINLNIALNVATITGSVALCNDTPSPLTYVTVSDGSYNNIVAINDDFTFSANIFYCEDDSEISVGAIDPINNLASGTSSYTISGGLEVGEILLCDELITTSQIYQFGDQSINLIFEGNNVGSVYRTYTVQSLEIGMQGDDILYKEIYLITTLNWDTQIANTSAFIYVEGQPLKSVTIEVAESGFKASGQASVRKVSQGGKEYLISTGTLSNIEETNPALYDPTYVELFFYMALEI